MIEKIENARRIMDQAEEILDDIRSAEKQIEHSRDYIAGWAGQDFPNLREKWQHRINLKLVIQEERTRRFNNLILEAHV